MHQDVVEVPYCNVTMRSNVDLYYTYGKYMYGPNDRHG